MDKAHYRSEHAVVFLNGDTDSCDCVLAVDHSVDAPGNPWIEDPYEWAGFM